MANQYTKANSVFATLTARILSRCVKDGDCLVWTGATNDQGYGQIRIENVTIYVHRVIWEEAHGPLPDGLTIDHVWTRGCHSRACCNEGHLEPVTYQVNTLRGNSRSAKQARRTHCPKGHALAGANLLKSQLRVGKRECRICKNARDLEWKRNRRRSRGLISRQTSGAEAS